jgi:hypothetical protein
MFLTKHPDTPIPTYETVILAIQTGSIYLQITILFALVGMIGFGIFHFMLLVKKFTEYSTYKKTEKYQQLLNSNSEVQLMAIPLTLGMTMNVLFVLSAVLIP